jgi:hypothetical protein
MTTTVSEVIRGWLGWCPNHSGAATQPSRTNSGMYILAAICVLVIVAATLLLPTPASQNVAVWAFKVDDTGTRHFFTRLPAMEETNGKLSFSAAGAGTGSLPAGKYWLVIEHPTSDGSYRLALDGQWVKMQSPDFPGNSIQLFRISGPGSLQEKDASEALVASFSGENSAAVSTAGRTGIGTVTEREYVIER